MKVHLSPSQSALVEIGMMFLPALPAYIWLWPNVSGSEWLMSVQSAVYVYFIAGALFIGLRRWNWDQLGLNRRGIGLSLACGALLVLARTFALLSTNIPLSLQFTTPSRWVSEIAFYFLLVGVGEELLFRGLMYRALEEWRGVRWAIWGTTLVFGLWHVGGRGLLGFAGGVIYGVLFGAIRWRAGGIVGLMIVHGLVDITTAAIVPENPLRYFNQVQIVQPLLAILTVVVLVGLPVYLWTAPSIKAMWCKR
jgi:membrane protease YdiL (CAAX protease family)